MVNAPLPDVDVRRPAPRIMIFCRRASRTLGESQRRRSAFARSLKF
jgi:hypothetical protein